MKKTSRPELSIPDDELELPPVEWLVKHTIPIGLTVLTGLPRTGTTSLAVSLAVAVANGATQWVQPGDLAFGGARAAYVNLDHVQFKERILAAEYEWDEVGYNLSVVEGKLALGDPDSVERVIETLREGGAPRLVIIDNLSRCMGNLSVKVDSQASRIIAGLYRIQTALNCALVVLDHFVEPNPSRPVLAAWADGKLLMQAAISVWKVDRDRHVLKLDKYKSPIPRAFVPDPVFYLSENHFGMTVVTPRPAIR